MGCLPVTRWAWPMWALYVTRLGAVLSWRMMGSSRPSLLLMNWVRWEWDHGASGMDDGCRVKRGDSGLSRMQMGVTRHFFPVPGPQSRAILPALV